MAVGNTARAYSGNWVTGTRCTGRRRNTELLPFGYLPITALCHLCKVSFFLVLTHLSLLIGSKKRPLQQNPVMGLMVLGAAAWEGTCQKI